MKQTKRSSKDLVKYFAERYKELDDGFNEGLVEIDKELYLEISKILKEKSSYVQDLDMKLMEHLITNLEELIRRSENKVRRQIYLLKSLLEVENLFPLSKLLPEKIDLLQEIVGVVENYESWVRAK